MNSHFTELTEEISIRMSHAMLDRARRLAGEAGFYDLNRFIEYLVSRWVEDASKREKCK